MHLDKIRRHHQPSPSTTTSLMSFTSSRTLDPQLTTISPWTLRSTRGSGRQLQILLASHFVWTNSKLTVKTKMAVYNACVLSTLLYGSETWTTYARQEKKLNTFHLRSIRRILGISWQHKVTNAKVLSRAGLATMYTLLRQRRLRWLGHVRRMEDGRITKDILYGELATGQRSIGRPQSRFKDVCKRYESP